MNDAQARQYAEDLIGCMGAWSIDPRDAGIIVTYMMQMVAGLMKDENPLPNPLAGLGAHAIAPHAEADQPVLPFGGILPGLPGGSKN